MRNNCYIVIQTNTKCLATNYWRWDYVAFPLLISSQRGETACALTGWIALNRATIYYLIVSTESPARCNSGYNKPLGGKSWKKPPAMTVVCFNFLFQRCRNILFAKTLPRRWLHSQLRPLLIQLTATQLEVIMMKHIMKIHSTFITGSMRLNTRRRKNQTFYRRQEWLSKIILWESF